MNFLRIWFDKIVNLIRKLFYPEPEPKTLAPTVRSVSEVESVVVEPVLASPAPAATAVDQGHEVSGFADCANANIALLGPVLRNTVSDTFGNFRFENLPDGTYTVQPSHPGKTFTPEVLTVVIAGADLAGVNFIDPSSPQDCRNFANFPNNSRTVQGALIYDVQKLESRSQGAPIDSRVSKPVDSRVTVPTNSRT